MRTYARRVRELLEEFANHGGGRLNIQFIDPQPFSEEEDEAAGYGLQGVPVGTGGETLYFGIAGTNAFDDAQAMPFLQPSKEQFLEYDLAKMVYTLGTPKKRTVGLLSSLPMTAGFDPATQSMREAWVVYDQLQQLFDIRSIDPAGGELPPDIEVLLLVHPRDLSESLQYQIDQFVLGGGRAIVFLDPFAEVDQGNPNDPMARMSAGSASSLERLTDAWGVEFDATRVLGDLQFGIGTPSSRHIGIISVPVAGLDGEDIVSADLEVVNLTSAGWISPAEGATTTLGALVRTSENAAPLDASRFRFLTNPADLLDTASRQPAIATPWVGASTVLLRAPSRPRRKDSKRKATWPRRSRAASTYCCSPMWICSATDCGCRSSHSWGRPFCRPLLTTARWPSTPSTTCSETAT